MLAAPTVEALPIFNHFLQMYVVPWIFVTVTQITAGNWSLTQLYGQRVSNPRGTVPFASHRAAADHLRGLQRGPRYYFRPALYELLGTAVVPPPLRLRAWPNPRLDAPIPTPQSVTLLFIDWSKVRLPRSFEQAPCTQAPGSVPDTSAYWCPRLVDGHVRTRTEITLPASKSAGSWWHAYSLRPSLPSLALVISVP